MSAALRATFTSVFAASATSFELALPPAAIASLSAAAPSLSAAVARRVSCREASVLACRISSSISSISFWTVAASATKRPASSSGVRAAGAGALRRTSVLRHLDPALAHRVDDGLGPIVHRELPEDRAHVVLDGLLADRQGVGDLLVGHALGDVVEDLDLARRQRREDRLGLLAVDGQLAELLEHARGDGRLREDLVVDEELALGHPP